MSWLRKFMKNADGVVDDEIILSYRIKANLNNLRLMLTVLLLLFLVAGLAIDLLHASFGSWDEKVRKLKIGWHSGGVALGLLGFIIFRIFFSAKKDPPYSKAFSRQFLLFSFVICFAVMIVCTMLTLIEQLYTTNLLFFLVSMAGIVLFLRIRQVPLAFILLPSLVLFWLLLPTYQANKSIVDSNIIFSAAITVAAFISNNLLEKKFLKDVLQQELIDKQTKSLLESNQAKDAILSVVAHDLRTPVANIDQLVELISHKTTEEADKQKFILLIKQSCSQAFEIIEDILEISTINKTKLQLVPANLCDIIDKVIEVHSNKSRQKNIEINFKADDQPVIAAVQPSKIERVIQNLLSNAIKFTPSGGKVEVSCFDKNGVANIQIKDNGIGIPEELLSHLFQPFSKARRTGIEGEKTFGLGLSIVKSIVENHHGTIEVRSHELRGTTFEINIPCFY